MDGYTLDDILARKSPTTKKKQTKRLWREIEELKDRRQLMQELKELDPSFNGNLDELFLK